jgi:hypothetical protein
VQTKIAEKGLTVELLGILLKSTLPRSLPSVGCGIFADWRQRTRNNQFGASLIEESDKETTP